MNDISWHNFQTGDNQNGAPILTIREDLQRNVVRAGVDNLYYNNMAELIRGSSIARSCAEVRSRFIIGDGFVIDNEDTGQQYFYNQILAKQILNKIAVDMAWFGGFALLIRYNALAQITEIKHIDYASVRLCPIPENGVEPEFAQISTDWRYAYSNQHHWATPRQLRIFTGNAETILADQRKYSKQYLGELIYIKPYSPGTYYYSPPVWAGAADRLQVDQAMGQYHAYNTKNGFFPGMMLYMPGTDWDQTDENGTTRKDAFQKWFDQKFRGARSAGEVIKLYGETADQIPQPVNFQPNVNGEMFISLEKNTVKYIPIAFQIPPILIGISESGKLGQSQNLLDEMEMFQNNIIAPEQDLISQTLAALQAIALNYSGKSACHIRQRKPISYLSDAVIAVMTVNEIRQHAGLAPLANE